MDEVGGSTKLQTSKDNKMDEEITGTAMHKENKMDAGSDERGVTTIRGSYPGSVAGVATSTETGWRRMCCCQKMVRVCVGVSNYDVVR